MIVYTEEECVEYNTDHYNILKSYRLGHLEALEAEAVNRINRDHLW